MSAGTLVLSRPDASRPGAFREEAIPFSSLDELIALCVRESGGAFVRVEVTGEAGGRAQRLVLDFGHFGPCEVEP